MRTEWKAVSKAKETALGGHAALDDQLCFALYAASRAVMGAYRTKLADLGLTYPQYLTMLAVWQADGSTVRELGDALDLDSGTLSPIIQRLREAQFVEKDRQPSDERAVHITCTALGWELEAKAALVREAVESSTGLSNEEFKSLRETLHRLRGNLKANS